MSVYSLVKPFLFQLDEEKAHELALSGLKYLPAQCFKKPPASPLTALGLQFDHPIGLAAGLDKNGQYIEALAKVGFSFIEVGTVTPKPQGGNPKPRLFRLPRAHAIINRMGFNNDGVDSLVCNVKKANYEGVLGINIGKNKDTPLDKALDDYRHCLGKVYEHASYVTINISSPNTPDLRKLQQGEFFSELLAQLQIEQSKLAELYKRHVPMVIKVSPDETEETFKWMAECVVRYGVEGVIVSNTTAFRLDIKNSLANEPGGLSGKPLASLSTNCLKLLKSYLCESVTLIGVGGIDSYLSAKEKLDAGATLLQLYSGLIYQGPGLVYKLALELANERH